MVGLKQFVRFRVQDYQLMQRYYGDKSFFKKVLYCWKKYKYQKEYNFAHMEFFCYHLADKTKAEVEQFYPRKHQAELYYKVNSKKAWAVTKDKFASYRQFGLFYKRIVCAFNPQPDTLVADAYQGYDWRSDVMSFLKSHLQFIIKPLSDACGHGVKIFEREVSGDEESWLDEFKRDYEKGFVIEELISQHAAIAKYHPSSVNTIRVNTFNSTSYSGGGIEVKFPVLRVGRKGSIVDNSGSGGIFIAIDEKNGKLQSAADEEFNSYREHPDTHVSFEGEIPHWNELVSIAKDVAKQLPELRIAGLDFALDKDKGWVLVEVNCEPHMLYEIATEKGIRQYMEEFERKLSNS